MHGAGRRRARDDKDVCPSLIESEDNLTSHETSTAFAKAHGAELTVMDGGEHWFHTDEQMQFLDNWIIKGRSIR